jgi:16S rRNA (guanine966-N2)-methyltransferase
MQRGLAHPMRVISGSAKGRSLRAVPGNSTRPTTDKVKEAIFSMIGPYFSGGTVLDLFAGTGALGIEALSRGMSQAIFVDQDKKAIETITVNLASTGFTETAEVYRNDALRAIKAMAKRQLTFELIFLDPPYKMHEIATFMARLQQAQLTSHETQFIVEYDGDHTLESHIGDFQCTRTSVYGDTAISIYAHT